MKLELTTAYKHDRMKYLLQNERKLQTLKRISFREPQI